MLLRRAPIVNDAYLFSFERKLLTAATVFANFETRVFITFVTPCFDQFFLRRELVVIWAWRTVARIFFFRKQNREIEKCYVSKRTFRPPATCSDSGAFCGWARHNLKKGKSRFLYSCSFSSITFEIPNRIWTMRIEKSPKGKSFSCLCPFFSVDLRKQEIEQSRVFAIVYHCVVWLWRCTDAFTLRRSCCRGAQTKAGDAQTTACCLR